MRKIVEIDRDLDDSVMRIEMKRIRVRSGKGKEVGAWEVIREKFDVFVSGIAAE